MLTAGVIGEPSTVGSEVSRSPTVCLPDFWIWALSTVMTGLDVSMSTRRMFEPVTVIVSSFCSSAGACGASCAPACRATLPSAAAVPMTP